MASDLYVVCNLHQVVYLGSVTYPGRAEYTTIDFRWDESVYGSVYWGLTGLHAMHVTAGLCVLALLFIRATRAKALDEVGSWAGGVSMFWHLVDIVWVAVFLTIWVIR